jgi:hypothetical protein
MNFNQDKVVGIIKTIEAVGIDELRYMITFAE